MTGPQLDELWSLIQRRWPSATAAKAPEVITEWSASLERLEYGDAMAAVVRLSEEETWFPQSVAPIMARAAEEHARAQRDQANVLRLPVEHRTGWGVALELPDGYAIGPYSQLFAEMSATGPWSKARMAEFCRRAARLVVAEKGNLGLGAAISTSPPPSPDRPIPQGGKDRAIPAEQPS